jgi:hypothetical protein
MHEERQILQGHDRLHMRDIVVSCYIVYCIDMTSGSLEHPLHAAHALDPLELMQTIQLSQL